MTSFPHLKRIFRLANTLHKCYEPNNTSSKPERPQNPNSLDPKILILPIFGIAIGIGLFYLTYKFADLISLFGGASVLLPIIFFFGGVSVAFFSLIELINTLYMSSDLSAIIVLPYSSLEIVCARLLGCLKTVAPIGFLTILPACLGFGIGASLDFSYFLTSILGTILIPIFSILAITSLIILVMSFVRVLRNRDLSTVFGILFGLIIIIFSSTFNSTTSEVGDFLLKNLENLANISKIIPIAPLLTNFYTTGNSLYLLSVIAILALVIVIFVIFTKLFYLKGALNVHSGRSHTHNISLEKSSRKSISAKKSLWKKELRTVFRTPAFYMNGWLMAFIWPIIIVIPIISSLNNENSLGNILEILQFSIDTSVILFYVLSGACAISLVFSIFSSMFCNLPYTAISREGSSFFFMQTIPVPMSDQLRAKLHLSVLISCLGSTPLILAISVYATSIGLIPFYGIFPMLLVNFCTVYLLNTFQLYLGTRHPDLSWTNIAQVGKSTSILFIILGFIAVFAFPGLTVLGLMYLPPIYIFLFYLPVLPILSFFLSRLLFKKSVKQAESL